jgi:hypothetical protein
LSINIILFIVTILIFPKSELLNNLHGEWIAINKNYRLVFNFDYDSTLEIKIYPEKEYSIYPQKFGITVYENIIYLSDKNHLIDSLEILKLTHHELILFQYANSLEIEFHKAELNTSLEKLDNFLEKGNLVINYKNEDLNDTIFRLEDYQLLMSNNIPCISYQKDILETKAIGNNFLIETTKDNETKELFIRNYDGQKIEGVIYSKKKTEFSIEEMNSIPKTEDQFKEIKLLSGYWVGIQNQEKFKSILEKEYKSIYIGYPRINIFENKELEIIVDGESEKGNWKLEKVQNIWLMFLRSGESDGWKLLGKIKALTNQFIIFEDIYLCTPGHLGSEHENKYYLIRSD